MFIIRNWLMWSWRLRGVLRPVIWQLVTQENQYHNWVQVERSENQKRFFLWHFIYSRWTGCSHSHWTSYFKITMTQILISPGNTIQTHLETMFNLGTPWPVKLTYKINHHRGLFGFFPAAGRVRSESSSRAARHISTKSLFGSLPP